MIGVDGCKFLNTICDLESIEKAALPAFCNRNLGELFIEYKESEVLVIEDGVIQAPKTRFKQGFGLRRFIDDSVKYSYSSRLEPDEVKSILRSDNDLSRNFQTHINDHNLYSSQRFMRSCDLSKKMEFLKEIDEYARLKDQKVQQVRATLASEWQVVCILDDSGKESFDIRPLVSLSVLIVAREKERSESGVYSTGGRIGYENILTQDSLKACVDEALRQALVKLTAIKAPVGEMPVLLGNGWAGILLHEAIGHGLEGDAIRKKTSAFYNLLGEQIAASNVTVVDDGTIPERRGSLNCDDEGSLTQRNVLIEDGRLVGFIHDRLNSRLMNASPTGNGRRTGYEYVPLPRMTNTFMTNGNYSFDEMVAHLKNGVFAKSFSGGQVDTTSGKFVFEVSEAYLIEDGKITSPIKGAMLIGDGPSILKKISMVGNDFSLDPGVGTCGKAGQWVPVGVGEPSLLIDKITIGGTDL